MKNFESQDDEIRESSHTTGWNEKAGLRPLKMMKHGLLWKHLIDVRSTNHGS